MNKDNLSDEALEQVTGGDSTIVYHSSIDSMDIYYNCKYAPDKSTFYSWFLGQESLTCPHKNPTDAASCRDCINLVDIWRAWV
jgi:hypothetical protein